MLRSLISFIRAESAAHPTR